MVPPFLESLKVSPLFYAVEIKKRGSEDYLGFPNIWTKTACRLDEVVVMFILNILMMENHQGLPHS